ncbi:MAG: rhombosortase [Verrucomicrobiota bacterium]|nr:rhombosortase [Verrucomicrobiota bacterium]
MLLMRAFLSRHGLTLSLGMMVLVAGSLQSINRALELSASTIPTGQWWQLLTAHLVHWSTAHTLWDLLPTLLLAGYCERRCRPLLLVSLLISSVCISLNISLHHPHLLPYRGLSGVTSTLFIIAGYWFIKEWHALHPRLARILGSLGVTAVLTKCIAEHLTRAPLFAPTFADGIQVATPAHAIGFLVGFILVVAAEFPLLSDILCTYSRTIRRFNPSFHIQKNSAQRH